MIFIQSWQVFPFIQCCGSGCISRILIFVPPGSRIQKQQQNRRVKKIVVLPFFCSHKNKKIENYIIFEVGKKKIWANYKEL
jgi:hypothetical protein